MKLDKNGFKELDHGIQVAEEKLRVALLDKGEAFSGDSNSWHDNFAYDHANRVVNELRCEIASKLDVKRKAELIQPHGKPNCVDLGDIVTLYDEEFDDEFKVRLYATYNIPEEENDIENASINSPLGEAVFGKEKDQTISYKVKSRSFTYKIKEIEKAKVADRELDK